MRTLSTTLLTAQQAASQTPYIKIEVKNKLTGVVRLDWERLYYGAETEYLHGVTAVSDGSLIRARITLPGEGGSLYHQRIANPGPQSNFSAWTCANQFNCLAVALTAYGAEVSIFWINGSQELKRLKSNDYGASWAAPEFLGYSLSTDIHSLTAAYKPNGDLAVFIAEMNFLTVKQCINGGWQEMVFWNDSTCLISSAAVSYHGDWNLLATGQDADKNYKVWSLTYGDGGAVPAGTWSRCRNWLPRLREEILNMVLSFSTALMLTALFTWKNSAARRVIYGPSARNLSLTLCSRTICGVNRNRLIFRQNTAWQLLTPAVTAGYRLLKASGGLAWWNPIWM